MKTKIINGELVYILEKPGHLYCGKCLRSSEVQIIKHKDLIHMLNDLFKRIENLDVNEKKEIFGPEYTMHRLLSTFGGYEFGGNYRIPIEIKDKDAVGFDDLKKKRMPRLFNWKSIIKNRVKGTGIKEIGQFKVYRGGLLKGL